MTRLFSQSTLTLRLSVSLSVERKLSRGRARQASLSFDCSRDMIDPICCKRKPLREKVHLLVSLMVSEYFESNRERIVLRLGEISESNGLGSNKVLSPSCSLEVASVKSSFSWGFSVYTRFESPFSVLDSVSSLEVISCRETCGVEEVTLALG